MKRTLLALLLLSCFVSALASAQTSGASPQAVSIASRAVAAFSLTPVRQIHLTGTAKAYAGSLEPSGTFDATLQSTGDVKMQLDIGELSRTDTVGAFAGLRHCQWTRQDGVVHDAALHNCMAALNWMIPTLDLQSRFTKLKQDLTSDTDQGTAVRVLSLTQLPGDPSPEATAFFRLSTTKLSLDQSTFLPVSLGFDIHPDNDVNTNITILVRYSDYRQVNGVSIPFHIQKYLDNGLNLDLQIESAEVQR